MDELLEEVETLLGDTPKGQVVKQMLRQAAERASEGETPKSSVIEP